MIITRTPFRISFAGGGTDLREFYSQEPGRVISTSIDKYIYVVIKRQLGIVEHKYRINWSHVEFKDKIEDIEHPIVKEALKFFKVDFPIEITTFSDIPGQTGLGSSSSFAVGLVNALHALRGEMVTKHTLASEAAHIEVDLLGRAMGKQDHFAAAYGNLNMFTFNPDESVTVEPVLYRPEIKKAIEAFYGVSVETVRTAIVPAKFQTKQTKAGLVRGRKSAYKKAMVQVASGETIDLYGNI